MAVGRVNIHDITGEDEPLVAAPDVDEPAEIQVVENIAKRLVDADCRSTTERRDDTHARRLLLRRRTLHDLGEVYFLVLRPGITRYVTLSRQQP